MCFIKVDQSQHKDTNRQKLRGNGHVYHLASVTNPNDLATIFELDPTSAQKVDDMVPGWVSKIFFKSKLQIYKQNLTHLVLVSVWQFKRRNSQFYFSLVV